MKARAAFQVFRAAGLEPPYGFALEDAEQLWAAKLDGVATPIILGAANTWVEDRKEFPTLNEFLWAVHEERSAQQKDERERNDHNHAVFDENGQCVECHADGYVDIFDADQPTYHYVRPCSLCKPEMHEAWSEGHLAKDHNFYDCLHPWCVSRQHKKSTSKRRGS